MVVTGHSTNLRSEGVRFQTSLRRPRRSSAHDMARTLTDRGTVRRAGPARGRRKGVRFADRWSGGARRPRSALPSGRVKRLLVVHHSPTRGTAALAGAALAGARDEAIEGVEVLERSPLEATADDVLGSDGVLLGTPANFG